MPMRRTTRPESRAERLDGRRRDGPGYEVRDTNVRGDLRLPRRPDLSCRLVVSSPLWGMLKRSPGRDARPGRLPPTTPPAASQPE